MVCGRPSHHLLLIGFVLLGCTELGAQRPAVQSDGVFVESGPPAATSSVIPAPGTLRERLVRIDLARLEAARASVGEASAGGSPTLLLNLFDDARFAARAEHTGPTATGYVLSGPLVAARGTATLVVNGDVVAGTVRAPGGTYEIRSIGDGVHVIRQVDPAAFPLPRDDAVLPPGPSLPESGDPPGARPIRPPDRSSSVRPPGVEAPPAEDGSRIDILVVYTPKAKADHGGTRAIGALIDLLVAETNRAYRASGVTQRVHLAGVRQVVYNERGRESPTILKHLTSPSDGHMDAVHGMRDRYAADIVHLMVDKTVRGRAYLNWQDPRWSFNFLGYTSGVFFAHENGHNMGLDHDRYEQLKPKHEHSPTEKQRYGWVPAHYSFGYVNQAMFEPDAPPSSRWWTIMAYPDQCVEWAVERGYDESRFCFRNGAGQLLRFSNPRRRLDGDRTGVPGTAPSSSVDGPADVRRSLNDSRRSVANFRRAPCLRDEMDVRLQAANGHYVVAVGNGGGPVRADQPRQGPRGVFTLVDHNGGPCVESGDTVSFHTSDGFYLRAARGGGAGVDATAPRATPWARFVARRHRGSGASRAGDLLTFQTHAGQYVTAATGGGGEVRADRETVGTSERFRVSPR